MSEQQFCLKWNNFHTNMSEVFHNMLQSESMVDVTIACEGASLKAHKMILAACSPFFQSLFMSNPCKHPIVILKDVRFVDLKATIDFVYKGEVNVNQSQLGSVLKAAETLKIKGLTDVVQRQRDLNAKEINNSGNSGSSLKKRRKKQKSKNSENLENPSSPSNDDSNVVNDGDDIPVTLEERSVPKKIFSIESTTRVTEVVELNVNQVNNFSSSSPVPVQTIISTTDVTPTENVQDEIIFPTDHTNLLENDPALRQISYEDTNQVAPIVTVTGVNDLSQFLYESGDQSSSKKRHSSIKRTSALARALRFSEETFYESGNALHCKACGEIINHMKASIIKYHIKSQKHQLNKRRLIST